MRVDIRIDSAETGSASGPDRTAAEHPASPAADVAPTDAGAAEAGAVGAGAGIDAGPPPAGLLAEIAAAGGNGAVPSDGWTPTGNGRAVDAVDAGSAPA